jgi:5-hydroxyisourate hydrolase-like protein (transthyretin family)
MDPITIILVAAVVLLYFAWYRPVFMLKPARERKELVRKFEEATNLNQQLLAELQQYTQQHGLLEKPFMEGETFRKKITELETARTDFFNEDNHWGLRSRSPKNLDIQLMRKMLEDQVIYHKRIQLALTSFKNNPPVK